MEVKEVDAKYLFEEQVEIVSGVVPEDYKKTEVGVIPKDWSLDPLNRLTNQIIDGTHHTPRYTNHGVPFLRVTDVQTKEIDESSLKYVSLEEHQILSKRCKPERGDLLLSKNGTIGIPKVADWDWEFSIFVSLAFIKLKKDKLLSVFLEQFFLSDHLNKQIRQRSKQGAVTNLHLEEIREFLVPLPLTLEEQTAIANALSDVNVLINSLENLIAKKQAIKTATMQQLLTGHTRLPQFATHPDGRPKGTKQSELGEIPKDWELVKLGEVMERVVGGGTPSRSNASYWSKDIPWVTVKDFATFNPFSSQEAITAEGLKNSASNLIPKGTLITSTRMALGKAVIYEVDVAINQDLKAIFPSDKLRTNYLYYWFAANESLIDELGSGSTVKGLSLSDLKAIAILLPLVEEQSSISAVLSDIDKEIESLSQRLEKTRQIKQGMMQELLTGRTRLVKPQQAAEVKKATNHNWQFNEAVVISVLADKFASHKFPLGRMRYTKLSYLLHRHWEGRAEGYKKKAAGPYNPKTRYGGPEKIAINNGYVTKIQSGKYMGYCSGENITKAVEYFDQWYGVDVVNWLEQFRYQKNDQLELLTTVDMAMVELRSKNREVSVQNVKALIENTPDWKPKLKRAIFSDTNIARAIEAAIHHFG